MWRAGPDQPQLGEPRTWVTRVVVTLNVDPSGWRYGVVVGLGRPRCRPFGPTRGINVQGVYSGFS